MLFEKVEAVSHYDVDVHCSKCHKYCFSHMPGECRYTEPYVCDDCSGAKARRMKSQNQGERLQKVVSEMILTDVQIGDLPAILVLLRVDFVRMQCRGEYLSDVKLEEAVSSAERIVEKYKR